MGLALGWAVLQLWRAWPPYGTGHGGLAGRGPVRRRGRIGWRASACVLGSAGAAVLLGATHPPAGPLGGWFGWSQTLLLFGLALALAAIDLRSLLVDIRLVALGIAARLASLALGQPEALWEMGAGLLIGAGFFHILALFYEVLRQRQGLGEGDAAVAGLLGAFIGWQGLLPMVGLAALTGLLAALPWLWAARRPAMTPIPFVPFLCGAGLAVYLGQLHGWPGAWPILP